MYAYRETMENLSKKGKKIKPVKLTQYTTKNAMKFTKYILFTFEKAY
jgi:hypothetical protein